MRSATEIYGLSFAFFGETSNNSFKADGYIATPGEQAHECPSIPTDTLSQILNHRTVGKSLRRSGPLKPMNRPSCLSAACPFLAGAFPCGQLLSGHCFLVRYRRARALFPHNLWEDRGQHVQSAFEHLRIRRSCLR